MFQYKETELYETSHIYLNSSFILPLHRVRFLFIYLFILYIKVGIWILGFGFIAHNRNIDICESF